MKSPIQQAVGDGLSSSRGLEPAVSGVREPAKPEAGQTVFGPDGRRAEYVVAHDGMHLVRPWVILSSWDGEEDYSQPGGIEPWLEIYPSPPVSILEEEIVRLQGDIDAKRRELAVATDEVSGFFRDEKERQARIKRHEALARLDDFIAGKITHVVKSHYGSVTVHEFTEVASPDDRYDRDGLKLLTLFGKPGNGLQWKINHYSDGSGQDTDVFPCQSVEEAHRIALSILTREFNSTSTYWLNQAIQSADALGIAVPGDVRERCRIGRLEDLTKARANKQAEIDALDAQIAPLADGASSASTTEADLGPGTTTLDPLPPERGEGS